MIPRTVSCATASPRSQRPSTDDGGLCPMPRFAASHRRGKISSRPLTRTTASEGTISSHSRTWHQANRQLPQLNSLWHLCPRPGRSWGEWKTGVWRLWGRITDLNGQILDLNPDYDLQVGREEDPAVTEITWAIRGEAINDELRHPATSRTWSATWQLICCRWGSGRCRNGPASGLLLESAFFQSGGVTRGS